MVKVRGQVAGPGPNDPALSLLRILDEDGTVINADYPSLMRELSRGELVRMYRGMLTIRLMDERLFQMQRQGRIGFYGEARGQEAAIIGAVSTLGPEDWVVPALREAGMAIYRGLSLRTYIAQIFGNAGDPGLGHQLPCHPGTRATRYVTMSSCIASQLPHATGLAWAAKIRGDRAVTLGCLGEGASSEPDFHVALNFAGVQKLPVVFLCQNNQWSISTPVSAQTASATIAVKAYAYGMPAERVDGNDVLAVHAAVKRAVDRARNGEGPTLVEALTYRMGPHSTSDDPTRYRDESITEGWKRRDPIIRFRAFLLSEKALDEAADAAMRQEIDAEVRDAVAMEEHVPAPALHTLIEQVYAEVPSALAEQFAELEPLPRQKLGGVHQ